LIHGFALGATFSRLTHFLQTGVHGKGLGAQWLRIANAAVSDEIAAAD